MSLKCYFRNALTGLATLPPPPKRHTAAGDVPGPRKFQTWDETRASTIGPRTHPQSCRYLQAVNCQALHGDKVRVGGHAIFKDGNGQVR
jgi:hypothetical protein